MPINCRIIDNVVEAPNGRPSLLFKKLEDRFGRDKALELYYLTEQMDYKDMLYLNTDANGEMNEGDFLKFVYRDENQMDLRKEHVDFLQKFSKSDIKKLDALYIEGIYQPTYENLKKTGLFTEDEIYEVAYSIDKKIALKNFIENFEAVDVSPVEDFKVSSNEYNSIGIKPLVNPSMVMEDVVERLLGANSLEELDGLVDTLPYQEVIEAYKRDETFRRGLFDRVTSSAMVQVVEDKMDSVKTLLNTMDIEMLGDMTDTLGRIALLQDKDMIVEELEGVADNLMDAGIEIKFDELALLNNTVSELKEFSRVLGNFMEKPNLENTILLAESLEILNKGEGKTQLVTFNKGLINPANLRYFETTRPETEVFKEFSMVRYKGNVYQKVNDKYDVDTLYEALYNRVLKKPDTVGIENLPSVENSYDKLSNELNKDVVIEDLRDIVLNRTKELDPSDIDTQEKIALYKIIYGSDTNTTKGISLVSPLENDEYIMGDFQSDFMKKKLHNKRGNTEEYRNFYRHFKVDGRGIVLERDDQFTKDIVLNNIPKDMVEDIIRYSQISKYLDLGTAQYVSDFVGIDRLRAQQDPDSVPEFKGDYQVADLNEVVANDSQEFIKIRGDVYEKILSLKDKALYKMLPKSNEVFKNTNISKPVTDKTPQFLDSFVATKDNTVKYKKYLTKKDLEEINQKHFECV